VGDPPGFRDFYSFEFTPLRDFGYVLTGSWSEAEELAQEAMVRTLRAWLRIRVQENPAVYARTVLVNRSRTLFRRSRLAQRHAVSHGAGSDGSLQDNVEDRAFMWAALLQLTRRQRAAIVLRYYEDLSEAQTAAILGVAVGTVKALVHKGLGRLRKELEQLESFERMGELT
jgi:RNA polymerase sigma-70 factor (sigma-E family)